MDLDKIIYYGATPFGVLMLIFILVLLVKQIKKNNK